MSKEDTLDLHASGSSSEFDGFSSQPEEEKPKKSSDSKAKKQETKIKSVVSKVAKGKSKVTKTKGKKTSSDVNETRVCSSDLPSVADPSTSGTSDPAGIFDFTKISEKDLQSLRTALAIEPQDNSSQQYPYDENDTFFDNSYYPYTAGLLEQRDNIRVQINASDISDFEEENYQSNRNRDLQKEFSGVLDSSSVQGGNQNDCLSWDLPKVKAPERGAPISGSLAKLINTACTAQCDTEQILRKYSIPENCEMAVPPLVNQEVWRYMDKRGHLQDKTFVDIQNLVGTAFVPVTKMIELLKKNNSMTEDIKTLFSDLLTVLGQAQYNLSLRRRYYVRPYLKKKYGALCNMSMPITTKLFGDDISKEVKSCENVTFLGKENYQNYNFRGPMRSRGSFRGRRGYMNTGYGNYNAQEQGFRQYPYPMRGNHFRSSGGAARSRAPRRRATATITSDPNDQI